MDLKFPLLAADDIEVKVKKVSEKGAIALLYKTARTDMNALDQTVGPLDWRCSYHDVKGNLYCEISIYDSDKCEWVSKEDCGIESREDDEGNQRKGEASDAFKRAGFKWGIGRELYTAPFTFIHCATKKKSDGRGYELENPFVRFEVKSIGYDGSGKIIELIICDDKGAEVFNLKKPVKSDQPKTGKPANPPKGPEAPTEPPKPVYIGKVDQASLQVQILRTGGTVKEWIDYLTKKFPQHAPTSIETVSPYQYEWSMKVLEKQPNKQVAYHEDSV